MRGAGGNRAVLIWMGFLLALPILAYALGVRGKDIENTTLVSGPRLTATAFLHGSTWNQAADAFSDHIPWRDRLIHLRAEVAFRIFHDSPNPGVIIVGRDNWLFLNAEFAPCQEYPNVGARDVAEAFDLADAVTETSGREFRGLVIPAKSTIEADHYRQSHYRVESCARKRERQLEKLTRGARGMIDLWPVFRAAKRSGHNVFVQTDSHANTYGSILIARTLLRSLRPGVWQDGLERLGSVNPYVGDLTAYGGINLVVPRHSLVVRHPARNPIRQRVLEITDSQLRQADPETRPYLPNRQLVDIDLLQQPKMIFPAQIRAARVLVVESVVRMAYGRVAGGFPDGLVDALLPDVPLATTAYREPQGLASATFVAPSRNASVTIATGRDDVHLWRLLVVKVLKAPAHGAVDLALDVRGTPLTSPDSSRQGVLGGATVGLAVPPGVRLADVRLSVAGPPGTTLSTPRVALLSR
jgi:hypothetical protein